MNLCIKFLKNNYFLPFTLFILTLPFNFNISYGQTGDIWWVSPSGNGSQTGTDSANAWSISSIDQNELQPGDFIYFIEGTYTTRLVPTKSGTATNFITYMPNPKNSDTVWFDMGGTSFNEGAHFQGVKYIRFKGFGYQRCDVALRVRYGISNIILDSLTITKPGGGGIAIFGNYNGGTPQNAGCDSVWIRWCNIKLDSLKESQTDGITAGWFNNLFIIGNKISQENTQGTGHNDCIQTVGGAGNVVIANNYLINYKQSESQIAMLNAAWTGLTTRVYNNVSIHKGEGISWFGYLGTTSPDDGDYIAYHNTAVGYNKSQWNKGTSKNNIYFSRSTSYYSAIGVPAPNTDSLDWDYNFYRTNTATTLPIEVGGYAKTLTYWQTNYSNQDLNSTTADPLFTDIANNDLTLQAGSPAKNFGTDLQAIIEGWNIADPITGTKLIKWTSIDNPYLSWSNPVQRGTAPTVGAWEFDDGSNMSNIRTNIKLLLQGPFNNGLMDTTIVQEGYFPNSQPYNTSPWNYSGNETLSSGSGSSYVDWVLIELRNPTNPNTVISRRAAIIRNDGILLDTNGEIGVTFNNAEDGDYYIAIFQRNHLAIMSGTPIQLSENSQLYDFTTGMDKAYGTNPMVELGNGKFGMYASDGDGNGGITISDRNEVWLPQNGTLGYLNGDFNLDGGVTIHDINLYWNNNNGKMSQVP